MRKHINSFAFFPQNGQRAFKKLALAVSLLSLSPASFATDNPDDQFFPKLCGIWGDCVESGSLNAWLDRFYPEPDRLKWGHLEDSPTKCEVNRIEATCYHVDIQGTNYRHQVYVRALHSLCPKDQIMGRFSKECRTKCPTNQYLVNGTRPGQCKPNPIGKEIDPDDTANPQQGDPACNGTGNPIHTASGNKFQREVDTAFGIPFIRYYNSDDTGPKNQLGLGWRHHWQARITAKYSTYIDPGIPPDLDPDGDYHPIDSGIKTHLRFYHVVRTDGASFSFLPDGTIIGATDKNTLKLTISSTGFTLFDGLNTERYDAKGNLVALEQGGGQRYTLTYADQLLTQVKEDSTGRVLTFTYARQPVSGIEEDQLIKVESGFEGGQKAEVASYEYGLKGRLVKASYPDGTSRQYVYDDPKYGDKLSGLIDENGVRFATWRYNQEGRAYSSEHAGGVDRYELHFDFWPDSTRTRQASPSNAWRTFYYQRVGRRLLYAGNDQPYGAGCGGSTSKLTYDQAGNPKEMADFNGNITRFTYDPERDLEVTRIEAATGPAPRSVSTEWHDRFRLPVQIRSSDQTVHFVYDGQANLLKKTVTAGGTTRSWSYGYDGFNRLVRVTNPAGQVGQFSYDAVGNLISTTDATGLVTTYGPHNLNGQALSITRPDGTVETMSYDARGRLLSHTQGDAVTRYGYAPTGLLKQVNLPDGSQIDYEYDPAHRLIGIRNNQGHSIRYTLDNAGNRIQDEVQDNGGALAAAMAQVETLRQSLTAPSRLQSKQQSE